MTTTVVTALLFTITAGASSAVGLRLTSRAARHWHAPADWLRDALCIHRHESVDWHRDHVDWRGRPSAYAGGLQFTDGTWRSLFAPSEQSEYVYRHPALASPWEQLYRARLNWERNGNRFGGRQWPHSSANCGVR